MLQQLQECLTGELSTDSPIAGDVFEQLQMLRNTLHDVQQSLPASLRAGGASSVVRRLELLASLFEQAQQGIVVVDHDGCGGCAALRPAARGTAKLLKQDDTALSRGSSSGACTFSLTSCADT